MHQPRQISFTAKNKRGGSALSESEEQDVTPVESW